MAIIRFLPMGLRLRPLDRTSVHAEHSEVRPRSIRPQGSSAARASERSIVIRLTLVAGAAIPRCMERCVGRCAVLRRNYLAHAPWSRRGKAREPQLFQAWGGKPSVAMLRHGDRRLSSSDKGRYRAFLERSVPGLKLASPRQEQRSREQADDGYQGATTWLLAQTRDRSKFELLFRENMNYGFRRNLWALRGWAPHLRCRCNRHCCTCQARIVGTVLRRDSTG